MTAASALRRVVTVQWPQTTDRQGRALLIRTARTGHQGIMADAKAKGFAPTWEAYANTPGNKNLASVVLPGPIVFKYTYISKTIIPEIQAELRRQSPVISGAYRDSHIAFLNGSPVAAVPALKAGDEVWIANPVPYARRLEVGKTTSGRAFVVQVAPHIYERVAKAMISKYRNHAKIWFGYVHIPPAHVIKGKLPSHYVAKGGVRRKRRQAVGSTVRSPAIFISVLT